MDSSGTIHQLCYHLSSVIGSLGPSIVFGYKGILLIFGIFLAYQTQSVRLKQTAQQLTERLNRMLNKPDVRLITSQNTLRSLWLMMLSESWPLPSPMLLPN
ncbi:hypothetical protein RRG08_034754 [Elysia crispata]|uniref:Uncharacterized protein n=1 Tax=Elysia crispata TaxID=231223 RepID=A0AAE0YAK5_9GAST|nr:hypothetical protein RRG08_034754 [Elysia crispata]